MYRTITATHIHRVVLTGTEPEAPDFHAVVFLVRLPWRFHPLGNFKCRVAAGSIAGTVFLHNPLPIHAEEDLLKPAEELQTVAAIAPDPWELNPSEADAVRQRKEFPERPEKGLAFQLLRRFLIAVASLRPAFIREGQINITSLAFANWTIGRVDFGLLDGAVLDPHSFWPFLSAPPLIVDQPLRTQGRLPPPGQIEELALGRLNDHIVDELRVASRSHEQMGSYRDALLYSVFALENAAYLVFESWYRNRRGMNRKHSAKYDKEVFESVPRELGLTLLVQFICGVLLDERDAPEVEVVTRALTAISLRNKIAHSLRTKSGAYHAREVTSKELIERAAAAWDLCDHLLGLIEFNR